MTSPPLGSQLPDHEQAVRKPQPVNIDAAADQLDKSMKHLVISTTPPKSSLSSSPSAMDSPHLRAAGLQHVPKSPSPALPSPVPRSASRLSVGRAASPALSRRGSMVSLQGAETTQSLRKVSSSRRLSSNRNSSSPLYPPKSPLPATAVDEPPPLTAQKIAADWFAKELEYHKQDQSTQTVVILHDACYGHRFSRLKTSKSHLSMIVERPERVLASILGIATAYVRFGERHAGGPHAPHPKRDPASDVPFTIKRSSRVQDITSPIVTNVHGTKWMKELQEMCNLARDKLAQSSKEVARIEEADKPKKPDLHHGDLYLSAESLDALQGALGGVCDGVDAVFSGPKGQPRNAFVCIRPPGHHCSSDWPSGFCWLNNVHVGIEYAAQNHGLTHAAIIDFDLHHGDGSQSITWERNEKVANMPPKQPKNAPPLKKTQIGYFSLHDVNSFPCEDGDYNKVSAASLCLENAHNQTIWNVHLQPWKTEEDFWKLYENKYLVLLEKARAFLRLHTQRLRSSPGQTQPKAAIFISAGFDASEWEGAGMQRHKVNVPTEFYARFTRDIVKMSQEPELGAEGRVISVLEGGYSNRALTSGVLSHISGLCEGQGAATSVAPANPFAQDVPMGNTVIQHTLGEAEKKLRYNVEWWHETSLYALETLVYPDPPPPPKKSQRSGPRPNFATPTQSFTRKVVDPEKFIKNSSGEWVPVREYARPPTPPPPDVDWVTAAHELSKLLVPTDRQTLSYRPEELAEPRVRKEKTLPPEVPVNTGRQLRERKAKVSTYSEPPSDDESFYAKTASRTDGDRRKTTDGVSINAGDEEAAGMAQQRRTSLASDATGERPTSKGSAVAVRQPAGTTAGNVQVKKTRTAPKKEVPAMKPPPRPFASRMGSHAEGKRSSSGASSSASHDVDQLTSGIKKITLKMPTKEEHDAKQNAAAEEEKAKRKATSTKTRGKVGVVRGGKTATAVAGRKPASPTTGSSTETGPPAATTNLGLPPGMPARTQSENDTTAKPNTRNKPPMHLPEARPRSLSRQSIENMAEEIMNSLPTSLGSPSERLSAEGSTPNGILETAEHVPAMVPRPDTPPPPPPASMPHFVNYEPAVGGVSVVGEGQQKPPLAHHPASAPALPAPATLRWVPLNADVDASIAGGGAANSSSAAAGAAGSGPGTGKPAAAPAAPAAASQPPLPVFTPSSHIPFGPAPGVANGALSLAALTGQDAQQQQQQFTNMTQAQRDGTAAGPESDRMQK
ncbi:histone deacetylase domain-containing protein [Phyllosticta paracitricarpa]|uniref:Histone deacetylase domain-containing protein n=1 Tax=Phyllosticta paracitricarpa TaxID=2016321 RepID=A0ABR1N1M1_9PEZI